MLKEHALTYRGQIKASDLEYIANKANRLGTVGRFVFGVSVEPGENDEKEVWFQTSDIKQRTESS